MKWKVVDKQDDDRVVQTFDEQGAAMLAADRFNAGWRPTRFLVYPMADGEPLRADHVAKWKSCFYVTELRPDHFTRRR